MASLRRWGQSAYETSADMAEERALCEQLGLSWSLQPDVTRPPGGRADVLVVTSKVKVTGEILDSVQPDLVCTTTSGFEHIDVAAATARAVSVARCPLARRDAVVEHTIAALVRLLRRFPDQEAPAAHGRWARADLPAISPRGLRGARVVVVGLGVIGARVAEVLSLLGSKVIGVDPAGVPPGIHAGDWPSASVDADAITLHASATPSALALLDRPTLESLPDRCVVINTARGDLMDPIAAAQLVQLGRLGGLACDVFPQEPWPELARFAGPNILLTPHSSGFTHDLGSRVAADVHRVLRAYMAGEPLPWPVN